MKKFIELFRKRELLYKKIEEINGMICEGNGYKENIFQIPKKNWINNFLNHNKDKIFKSVFFINHPHEKSVSDFFTERWHTIDNKQLKIKSAKIITDYGLYVEKDLFSLEIVFEDVNNSSNFSTFQYKLTFDKILSNNYDFNLSNDINEII